MDSKEKLAVASVCLSVALILTGAWILVLAVACDVHRKSIAKDLEELRTTIRDDMNDLRIRREFDKIHSQKKFEDVAK